MLPKLIEPVKPVPLRTQNAIGKLVEFARNEVPASIWLEEFGDRAPRHIIQRHEHHYHLHLHEYRELSHHVRHVVTWENEFPMLYWPTVNGMIIFLVAVAVLVCCLLLR